MSNKGKTEKLKNETFLTGEIDFINIEDMHVLGVYIGLIKLFVPKNLMLNRSCEFL